MSMLNFQWSGHSVNEALLDRQAAVRLRAYLLGHGVDIWHGMSLEHDQQWHPHAITKYKGDISLQDPT